MLRHLRLIVQVLGDLERRNDVIAGQLGVLACSQQTRDLQYILDLPTVHIHARKLVEFRLGNTVLLG